MSYSEPGDGSWASLWRGQFRHLPGGALHTLFSSCAGLGPLPEASVRDQARPRGPLGLAQHSSPTPAGGVSRPQASHGTGDSQGDAVPRGSPLPRVSRPSSSGDHAPSRRATLALLLPMVICGHLTKWPLLRSNEHKRPSNIFGLPTAPSAQPPETRQPQNACGRVKALSSAKQPAIFFSTQWDSNNLILVLHLYGLSFPQLTPGEMTAMW